MGNSAAVRAARARLFVPSLTLFLAFLVLAVLVTRGMTDSLDARLLLWVQAHLLDRCEWFWLAVSWPGYAPQSYGMAAMMVYLAWGYTGRRGGVLMVIAFASQLLGTVVKEIVQRPRPTPEAARVIGHIARSASYPSGHVVTYTIILGLVTLLIRDALPAGGWARRRDRTLCALFVALIALVGPSRVALGQHWPTDVAGGYLLGGAVLVLLAIWRRPA